MRHTFHAEQWLPYSVETVFAFFANPENLPRLMPGWQKARIEEAMFTAPPPRPVSGAAPVAPLLRMRGIVAGNGTTMTISFRPVPFSPIRVPWEAEIVDFAWNDRFCDVQLRGPFAYWRHCHTVIPEVRDAVSGTVVRDQVEYEMRLGKFGELAHSLVGRRQIARIFAHRQRRTAELLPLISPGR